MKKIYTEAELEIINLLGADIITASGGGNNTTGDNDFDASDDKWG